MCLHLAKYLTPFVKLLRLKKKFMHITQACYKANLFKWPLTKLFLDNLGLF